MKKKIKIINRNGVKKWIVRECIRFAVFLENTRELKHNLRVLLVNNPAVKVDNDEKYGFGVFVCSKTMREIVLACNWLPYREDGIKNRADANGMIMTNFAHEWCHYEDYAKGVKGNHRRMEIRVKNIMNEYLKYIKSDAIMKKRKPIFPIFAKESEK